MDNKVTELRGKLTELRALAKMDLDKIPTASRPGWEAKQRNAKSQLESLEDSLAQEILNKSVTLVVEDKVAVAKDIAAYLNTAEGAEVAVLVDYMALENELTTKLFAQVTNGTFPFNGPAMNQINILLSEIGDAVGVIQMPIVNIPGSMRSTLSTREEAVNRVSSLLRETYGNDFKSLVIRKTIMDEARKKLNMDRLAIVVYNVPLNDLSSANILRTKSVTIAASEGSSDAVMASEGSTGEELVKQAIKKMSGKRKKTVADETAQ